MAKKNKKLAAYSVSRLDNFGSRYRHSTERYLVKYTFVYDGIGGFPAYEHGTVVINYEAYQHLMQLKTERGREGLVLKFITKAEGKSPTEEE